MSRVGWDLIIFRGYILSGTSFFGVKAVLGTTCCGLFLGYPRGYQGGWERFLRRGQVFFFSPRLFLILFYSNQFQIAFGPLF